MVAAAQAPTIRRSVSHGERDSSDTSADEIPIAVAHDKLSKERSMARHAVALASVSGEKPGSRVKTINKTDAIRPRAAVATPMRLMMRCHWIPLPKAVPAGCSSVKGIVMSRCQRREDVYVTVPLTGARWLTSISGMGAASTDDHDPAPGRCSLITIRRAVRDRSSLNRIFAPGTACWRRSLTPQWRLRHTAVQMPKSMPSKSPVVSSRAS